MNNAFGNIIFMELGLIGAFVILFFVNKKKKFSEDVKTKLQAKYNTTGKYVMLFIISIMGYSLITILGASLLGIRGSYFNAFQGITLGIFLYFYIFTFPHPNRNKKK